MPSAFAPKHYPKDVIAYANPRGADKVMYAGYYPMGLSLERIFTELPNVPFKDDVWPKFLRENALRVFKLTPPYRRTTPRRGSLDGRHAQAASGQEAARDGRGVGTRRRGH